LDEVKMDETLVKENNELFDHEIQEIDLESLVSSDEQIDFEQLSVIDGKTFALSLVEVCDEYVGTSRSNNIDQVARFLKLFGLGTKSNGKWVPYCAAGLSFAAAKNFCNLANIKYNSENALKIFRSVLITLKNRYFMPTPSCYQMKNWAIKQGKWLPNTATNRAKVKKGYLILFQFDKDTLPDHVGIVISIDSDSVQTIEFNTGDVDNINGGTVARKNRPFKVIQGFIKLY